MDKTEVIVINGFYGTAGLRKVIEVSKLKKDWSKYKKKATAAVEYRSIWNIHYLHIAFIPGSKNLVQISNALKRIMQLQRERSFKIKMVTKGAKWSLKKKSLKTSSFFSFIFLLIPIRDEDEE